MSDLFYPGSDPDGQSIDELIAQTRQQLDELDRRDAPATPETECPAPEEEFIPDFGAAFDDYGAYDELPAEDETDELPEELPEEERPALRKPKGRARRRLVPLFVKVLLYLVLTALIAVGLGYGLWECATDFLAFGRSDEALTVTVRDEDTVDSIAQMLKDKGVIQYPWLFKFYCKFTDSMEDMDPGTYEIYYNYDYHALVNGMAANSANRTTVRVMIPEGYTCAQIFALMEKNNVCTAQELAQCAASASFDYWFLEDISASGENRLEGFLFPDTYDFYENDDPERVLNKLLSNFSVKFTEDTLVRLEEMNALLAERLRARGYDDAYIAEHALDVYDVLIVASMIEKESAGAEESTTIASVIYNRLCNPGSFPCLQIDGTVVYALGGVNGSVSYEDTQVDSPYNTYLNPGLPIGPISNPGLSSLTAALYPADTGYYYYALNTATGLHHFSATYDEHQRFLQEQSNAE